MQVTQQQAVPYQFFQGVPATGATEITWPDQYEGVITDISVFAGSEAANPVCTVEDASGVAYAAAGGLQVGSAAIFIGHYEGFAVIPSGSVLQVNVNESNIQVSVSGWLLHPTGAAILAE
jgi:hypothetical protein